MTTISMPEPPDGALVLRSYADKPDEVLIRDDMAAKEWDGAADNGERWFTVGDYESDPICWTVVTQAVAREGATLAELVVKPDAAPLVPVVVADDEIAALLDRPRPLPAAEQPLRAIVATYGEAFMKCEQGGHRPWRSADRFVSDGTIDQYLAAGAELLRGEVTK